MQTWEPVITGIIESGIADDFSSVRISFKTEHDQLLTCQIQVSALQRIIIHLSEMAAALRRHTPGRKRDVLAIVATNAKAHLPLGKSKVILEVRAGNNVLHHFSLTPEIASALQASLQAIESGTPECREW